MSASAELRASADATLDRLETVLGTVEPARLLCRAGCRIAGTTAGRDALRAARARLTAAAGVGGAGGAPPEALAEQIQNPADREALAALALVSFLPAGVSRLVREGGMTADAAWASVADVPRKLAAYGVSGTGVGWLAAVATGHVVGVGRLQFSLGERTADGSPAWGVHVPEGGRLDAHSCDESFAAAPAILARLGGAASAWTCTSWMLDQRLSVLGPDSNLVRFAERFQAMATGSADPHDHEGDAAVAKFVFRLPLHAARAATPVTRLQHLIAGVWASGGSWRQPTGLAPVGPLSGQRDERGPSGVHASADTAGEDVQ